MKKVDEIKQKYTNNEISSEQALRQVLDLFDVINSLQRYDVYSTTDKCGDHCLYIDKATEEDINSGACDGQWVKWEDIANCL